MTTVLERGFALGGALADLVQRRPILVAALVAVGAGGLVGSWLGGRSARRRGALGRLALAGSPIGGTTRKMVAAKTVRDRVEAGASLVPLAIRFLSNPLVQLYLRRALMRQVARKLGR